MTDRPGRSIRVFNTGGVCASKSLTEAKEKHPTLKSDDESARVYVQALEAEGYKGKPWILAVMARFLGRKKHRFVLVQLVVLAMSRADENGETFIGGDEVTAFVEKLLGPRNSERCENLDFVAAQEA